MTWPGMRGFGKMFAGSVLLHAALLAAAALVYSGANRVFIAPVYTVDLVAGHRPHSQAGAEKPAAERPAPPAPVEAAKEAPAPPKPAEPVKTEPVKAAPAPKKEAPSPDAVKVQKKPTIEDALKKIEKKVEHRKDEALVASSIEELKHKMEAERLSREKVARLKEEIASRGSERPAPQAAVSPAPARQTNPASGGGAQRVSLEEKYSAYYGMLRDRVQENWIYPQGLKDNTISVIVSMKIARSGKLLEVAVERSSGNRAFDDSLLKAIRKAEPFPPLPVDLEGSFLETGLRFCPGCAQ